MRRLDLARVIILAAAAALAATSHSTALGQTYDFTFALGYSHIDLDNSDARFHNKDGGYFDMDFAFHLDTDVPLNAGFGITGSGYYDSDDVTFRLSSTTTATTTIYSSVGFFALEPRVSIPLYSDGSSRTGFFIRPRLGMGLLIDSYAIDHVEQTVSHTSFGTDYHTGVAFEIRPALQAGFSWGPGEFGAEVSYMAAWGDFGAFGSSVQEFRAGAFYTFRL